MAVTDSTPTSVYRYYDKHGILIYVGITSRGVSRNLEHNKTKEWWSRVESQDVQHFQTRPEALNAEREAIERFKPPFNTKHNANPEGVRTAYLALAETLNGLSRKPKELLYQRRGKIQLSPIGECWVTTLPEDWPVMRLLAPPVGAKLYETKMGQVIGSLGRIEVDTRTVRILLNFDPMAQKIVTITGPGFARVKLSQHPPLVAEITQANMPVHMARTFVTARTRRRLRYEANKAARGVSPAPGGEER